MGLNKGYPGGISSLVRFCTSTFNGTCFFPLTLCMLILTLFKSFVYALYDLVDHPEYITLLRDEIATLSGDWESAVSKLPLLDSFLKESARLSPSDSISLRRKALKTFVFSDGTIVPKGSWACVPQKAIQRDSAYYENPSCFDGHRFVHRNSSFTDLSPHFPFWGLGKRAW